MQVRTPSARAASIARGCAVSQVLVRGRVLTNVYGTGRLRGAVATGSPSAVAVGSPPPVAVGSPAPGRGPAREGGCVGGRGGGGSSRSAPAPLKEDCAPFTPVPVG
ncbi:hypothetical protein GCM10027075_62730 [Streptomyces heilongjiangensis]